MPSRHFVNIPFPAGKEFCYSLRLPLWNTEGSRVDILLFLFFCHLQESPDQ